MLTFPETIKELGCYLSSMTKREAEIEKELDQLNRQSVSADQFIAMSVLCSPSDVGVGGGTSPGMGDPVFAAYQRAQKRAEEITEEISRRKKELNNEKWLNQYIRFLMDNHLTEMEAALIRNRYFNHGGYETIAHKLGKKNGRTTYFRRLDDAMEHLLIELTGHGDNSTRYGRKPAS